MERRHVEYTCRQETESTSFPIFDREELESCNTKFPRNTELRCSRSSRELSFVVWLPNFSITAWWDGDVRFFGCNHENESSPCHCRMIFHKGLYWKAMEAPEKLSSDEQRWKQLVMGYHFQARVLYLGTTVFWFIPLYLSSFLLAFIYISWFLAENVIFLERSIALPSFLYQLEFLNLFQIKQYTRTSTWNLNCPRCVFSSRLNIRLAAYLKTT